MPCIRHERVPQYYEIEERLSAIVQTILEHTIAFSGKELTPANVSTEIPEAAKSLYAKGKILFQKQFFKEAARAFLGATLHCPTYTEAQNSLASALKFLDDPSSGPQIFSSAIPMPGTSAPTSTKPPRTKPEPTPAAAVASLQTPAAAPAVYNIDELNTGTIVHNTTTTYAPRVNYAPVTQVTDARRVVDKSRHIYAPQTTYAPANYNNTSYHINYGAPSSSREGAPAAIASPQNKPAAPVLPDYVKNAKTPEGRGKALIKAIDRKERDMVDYLLEKGAKLDVEDEKHRTPLQTACEGNWPEVVQLLIDNGAKTDGEDAPSSLIVAAKAKYRGVVKILLRHNTPFIWKGESWGYNHYKRGYFKGGCGAFEIFVRDGDLEMVSFFLDEMKINLRVSLSPNEYPMSMGEYALDVACEIQNSALVQALLDKGAKINKALLIVTDNRNLPILRLLCGKKKALHPFHSTGIYQHFLLTYRNQKSNHVVQSLMYAELALLKACERGDLEFVQLLITTTDLTKTLTIDDGCYGCFYLNLAEIAYQVGTTQDIKNLFPLSLRTRGLVPIK
ncbi:MAG: ankyrin repeat domain-containing protein [Verrucomicrobia bacterium]|nr:ankyrin repeat domain-containing protein [Verrucomicrobiota bacterium]